MRIRDTKLSPRTQNALRRHGIETVRELVNNRKYGNTEGLTGVGPKAIREIDAFLKVNSQLNSWDIKGMSYYEHKYFELLQRHKQMLDEFMEVE